MTDVLRLDVIYMSFLVKNMYYAFENIIYSPFIMVHMRNSTIPCTLHKVLGVVC
jgi:hypothetical protein